MDLIAISDIYGDVEMVKELLRRLEGAREQRVIVVAGDIGITSEYQERHKILSMLAENAKYVLYVAGDTDPKDMKIDVPNVINLDGRGFFIEINDIKLGFIGLGGAPRHSVRKDEPLPNLFDESIQIVRDRLLRSLRISLEKIMLNRPDYVILVTHSPPYGMADRSTPITLREFIVLEEILADVIGYEQRKEEAKKVSISPRKLGSRIIRDFVINYKPDIHIFGHVHKQGGKVIRYRDTTFFNVSHLSPLPYRLTGRKFLLVRFKERMYDFVFDHLVLKNLPFEFFLESYL